MVQFRRKITYANYGIPVKHYIIGPGLLDVVSDLPDYFLLLCYVSISELGVVLFQKARMFGRQCDILAKSTFLF
jgi:hypothetical protein